MRALESHMNAPMVMSATPTKSSHHSGGPGPVCANAVVAGSEVAVTAGAAVVTVVGCVVGGVVVAATGAVVVVVAVGAVSPWYKMMTLEESLAWSPKLMLHVAPAAC